MPTKVWAVGEELLAADMNTFVQQQVVSTFPNAAARDASSLPEGSLCVTLDLGTLWRRNATVWVPAIGLIAAPRLLTANQAGITTEVDVTGLAITFTAEPARYYRATLQATIQSTIANDRMIMQIKDGATAIQALNSYQQVANVPASVSTSVVVTALASGVHTFKVTAQRFAGTGTVTVVGSATSPAYLSVEDIGRV
jgi:uroporphyrinogen-III decarboxylase